MADDYVCGDLEEGEAEYLEMQHEKIMYIVREMAAERAARNSDDGESISSSEVDALLQQQKKKKKKKKKKPAEPVREVTYTMSAELLADCRRLEAMQNADRGSLAALELAQANLERILREIAAFRRTYPGLEEDFASHLLRQVEAHVFESMALYACTLEGRGAYREALGYVAKAELFSERRGDAWAVKVAQVVMDVAKAAFRNLGEMEAYAAAAMRQATMYGKLGLGNEFMVQAYCEATTAQIDLRDFRGAIASSTAALRVAETAQGESYARCKLGLAYLTSNQAGLGLPHLEAAEKLRVHGPGEFFEPDEFSRFRRAVATNLQLCRRVLAHEAEVAEDAVDLAAIGAERTGGGPDLSREGIRRAVEEYSRWHEQHHGPLAM